MALKCPVCGATIPAENVNIQEMVALCEQCSHVFSFKGQVPARKAKPRKVRQPDRLVLREEDDRLEMRYRWVFSLSDRIGLAASSFVAFVLTVAFASALDDPGAQTGMLLFTGLLMIGFWYLIAVMLSTTTRISADEDAVSIHAGPLPFPLHHNNTLDWQDVVRMYCKETVESRRIGSPERYYHVLAEMTDGTQEVIDKALPQQYAFFIAQVLDDRLPAEEDTAVVVPGDEFLAETTPEQENNDEQGRLVDGDRDIQQATR